MCQSGEKNKNMKYTLNSICWETVCAGGGGWEYGERGGGLGGLGWKQEVSVWITTLYIFLFSIWLHCSSSP